MGREEKRSFAKCKSALARRSDLQEGLLPAPARSSPTCPPLPGGAARWGAPAPSPTPLETWAPRGRGEGVLRVLAGAAGARAGPRAAPPRPTPHGLSHNTAPDSVSSLRPHCGGPLTHGLGNVPGAGTRGAHCPHRPPTEGSPACPASGPPGGSTAPRHSSGPGRLGQTEAGCALTVGPGPGVGAGVLFRVCPQAPEPSAADQGQRGHTFAPRGCCAGASELIASASVPGPPPPQLAPAAPPSRGGLPSPAAGLLGAQGKPVAPPRLCPQPGACVRAIPAFKTPFPGEAPALAPSCLRGKPRLPRPESPHSSQ